MAASSPHQAELQSRIDVLEKQVAGLMATVTLMHQKMNLRAWKIPTPNQYLPEGNDEHEGRDHDAKSVPLIKASKSVPSTAPSQTPPKAAVRSPNDLITLEQFQYSPLKVGASEIRIISILKSEGLNDPIECEMITKSLPDSLYDLSATQFMPLSYTWGGLAKTETIVMNGKSFKVTANLHVALKHFRNANPQSLLPAGYSASLVSKGYLSHWWIDAISINQDDLDERKSQVALMTRLYRMAQVAHVWLGEEADDSSRAMELIKELSRKATEKEQRDHVERKPGQTRIFRGPGTVPEEIANEPPPLSETERSRNYQSLVQLFKRDWFSRVWILQEIALPRSVSVHCGDQVCTWNQMMRTTSLLVYLADEYRVTGLPQPAVTGDGSVASIFQRAESLMRLRNVTLARLESRNPYLSLMTALLYAKNSKATDQRDKVFAILPLVSPDSTSLTADYHQSRLGAYTKAALDLSQTGLDFLSACQYIEGVSSELPSWVPDFSQPWRYYPMRMTLIPKDLQDQSNKQLAVYQPDEVALKVRGYIVDTLTIIKDLTVTAESSKADIEALKSDWETFVTEKDIDGSYKANALDNLRHYSSGSGMYWPLYKTAYVGGKGEQFDLSIRAFNRHLATTTQDIELKPSQKTGWYRNFFLGRRFALSEERHAGVVPAAARAGDKICIFKGSDLEFILRETDPGRWIVIGDSRTFVPWVDLKLDNVRQITDRTLDFLGNYSHYHISTMRPVPKLQDIVLV